MSFWKRLFGSETQKPSIDPLQDLILEKLKPGYLVDYDSRTWQVTAQNSYDMGDGIRTEEWELRADGDVRFLCREEADGTYWTFTRKVPLGLIDEGLRKHIEIHGDPPQSIEHQSARFFMDTYGGAKLYRNREAPAQPFLYWEYRDEEGREILIIEQWGDIEFNACIGRLVEEYQFINILPGNL